jgi:hypothetical protein
MVINLSLCGEKTGIQSAEVWHCSYKYSNRLQTDKDLNSVTNNFGFFFDSWSMITSQPSLRIQNCYGGTRQNGIYLKHEQAQERGRESQEKRERNTQRD